MNSISMCVQEERMVLSVFPLFIQSILGENKFTSALNLFGNIIYNDFLYLENT